MACSKVLAGPRGAKGVVVACDLLDIDPIEGAQLIPLADFTEEATQSKGCYDPVLMLMNSQRFDFPLNVIQILCMCKKIVLLLKIPASILPGKMASPCTANWP